MGTDMQAHQVPFWNRPPIETLTDTNLATTAWPERLTHIPEFQSQIRLQEELLWAYREVTKALAETSPSLRHLVKTDQVASSTLTRLFNGLSDLLETDKVYARLILFLPFALTEPLTNMDVTRTLYEACNRFHEAYRNAFKQLLYTQDVRANFVDGNVLEQELRHGRDHTRVIKVMHLVPSLISIGFMDWNEVVRLTRNHPDPLVQAGLGEASTVLRTSDEQAIHQKAPVVAEALASLAEKVRQAGLINPADSTPNRTKWLRKQAVEQAIAKTAEEIVITLLDDGVLPTIETCSIEAQRAIVDAIRQASLQNVCVFDEQHEWLSELEKRTINSDVLDAIDKLYRHLNSKGIVELDDLIERDIRVPNLAGAFSANLPYLSPSTAEIKALIRDMESDNFLSTRVYPVVILLGSQLKGYGIGDADADVAVFIKPGVSDTDEAELVTSLVSTLNHERIGGSISLFWLDNESGTETIRKCTHTIDPHGLETWTHILWNGAWVGNTDTIEVLRHALLPPYFFETEEVVFGISLRAQWFEELERDAILYRLLHKGYERFHPVESPYATAADRAIDGNSAFYDPQFRRIATELYLTHVFLPNLGHAE